MKGYYKMLCVAALMGYCAMGSMNAKVKKTNVYMFGFAASYTDSVAYITDIQRVDSVTIDEKTDFLMDRNQYSFQLQQHVAQVHQKTGTVTAIYFDKKKAKIEKNALKVMQTCEKEKELKLMHTDFRFQSVEWIEPEILNADDDAAKNKKRAEKKTNKKKK